MENNAHIDNLKSRKADFEEQIKYLRLCEQRGDVLTNEEHQDIARMLDDIKSFSKEISRHFIKKNRSRS